MAGKNEIETAAADAVRHAALHADAALAGYAGRLAAKLMAASEPFLAEPSEARELLKTAQTITGLARAAIALHQAQAQEDKAAERIEQRIEAREVAEVRAKTRARIRQHFTPDEDDNTDMNEKDPRLDTPEGVAEIYREAEDALDFVARRLERKAAERRDDGGKGAGGGDLLAPSGEGRTASAH